MNMDMNLRSELKARIRLLSRGILLPRLSNRKNWRLRDPITGAGPPGAIFRYSANGNNAENRELSMPVYTSSSHLSRYAIDTREGDEPNTIITEDDLKLVKRKELMGLLSQRLVDELVAETGGVAMHCYNTLATMLGWDCRHFRGSRECRFCDIVPMARNFFEYPRVVDINCFADAIENVDNACNIRSINISTGTYDHPDIVARQYIDLLRKLRTVSHHAFGIQLEPVHDLGLLKSLSEFAETCGIFIEIFDEATRKRICPGKSTVSKDDYIRNWEAAVEYFGRGNVGTTCMLGFGEDFDSVLREIEEYAKIGVRTALIFARFRGKHLNGQTPSYFLADEDELVDFHIEAGAIQVKYDVDCEREKKAGCAGCNGCNAMMEACDCARWISRKKERFLEH